MRFVSNIQASLVKTTPWAKGKITGRPQPTQINGEWWDTNRLKANGIVGVYYLAFGDRQKIRRIFNGEIDNDHD